MVSDQEIRLGTIVRVADPAVGAPHAFENGGEGWAEAVIVRGTLRQELADDYTVAGHRQVRVV